MTSSDFAAPLGHGIHAIDTGFQRERFDAAYLLVDSGRAAFIDTGTHFAVPRLLAALDAVGLPRDAVDYVLPTHVHLDHAGGVGSLLRELPNARVLVHPRGLRHLLDPSALCQGALAVYGAAAMARDYGEVVPVDAARAAALHDGDSLTVGSRRLVVMDTPGHALHHHCLWDQTSGGWFSGDTFGISYREVDTPGRGPWILVSSTPVQFDPEAHARSLQRLLQRRPRCMYLTHFGRVADVERLGSDLQRMLARMAEIGREHQAAPQREARLREALRVLYLDGLRAHGCTLPDGEIEALLAMDLDLNAMGLGLWAGKLAN